MFRTRASTSTLIFVVLLLAASFDPSYAAATRKKLQAALTRTAESNLQPWTQWQQARGVPFTTADVDKLWAKYNRSAVRFFLRNGSWTMNGSADWYPGLDRQLQGRGGEVHELLIELHAKLGLPEGLDLVWNMYDIPLVPASSQAYKQLPLFSLCSREGFADVPGISGGSFLFRYPTFNRSEVLARHPWKTRGNTAFWRGSPTGGNFSIETWRDHVTFYPDTWPQYRRPQLVNLSQHHPDLLDAKFPSCVQCAPGVFEQMQKQLGQPKEVAWPSPDELMSHKYIVDLDGNGWTERFLGQLAQQTAILKVQPVYREFYWKLLQPYVHYVPVSEDLHDLVAQIEYARAHDKEMEDIAKAARGFAIAMAAKWHSYMHKLLVDYHSLFLQQKTWS